MGVCAELKRKVTEALGAWPNDPAQIKEEITAEFKAEPNKEEREKFSFQSFGAVFVEVRVDSLGQVRVERATGVYDVGRMVNPRLARSQIMGGMLVGFGMALMEANVPDENVGQVVNADHGVYHIPVYHCIRC